MPNLTMAGQNTKHRHDMNFIVLIILQFKLLFLRGTASVLSLIFLKTYSQQYIIVDGKSRIREVHHE